MSHVYILPLKNRTSFKIGKSDAPMERITRLLNFYDVDVENISVMDCGSNAESYSFESLLHTTFREHQVILENDGGTEFFKYLAYEDTIELCKLICRIRGYTKIPFKMDKSVKPLSSVQLETNKYSNLVKNTRLGLNVTRKELAKATNVSQKTIERFETTGQATFENVISIFSSLGIRWCFEPVNTNRKRANRKIYVGPSDHEPDSPLEIEITTQ
jgi:hypothetical protein